METIYQPDFAGLDKNIWIASFTALSSVGILFWLKFGKKVDQKIRPLGQLLMGFATVISLGVVTFSYLATNKLTDFTIDDQSIRWHKGTLTYNEVKRVYIQIDQPGTGLFQVNAGPGTHYLVIEPVEGMNIILSEINYPIFEMKETIDRFLVTEKN